MNFQITKLKQKRHAKEYRSIFEKHKVISNLDKINQKILEPDFWNNKSEAQKIFKKKKFLEELVNTHKKSITEVKDLADLFKLANEENIQSMLKDIIQNIENLKIITKKNEIKCFLSNESDILDCYMEIHAGAGGTESQDWAEMLKRMYFKWAQNKGFKTGLISEHKGDEAGLKSTVFKIEGEY